MASGLVAGCRWVDGEPVGGLGVDGDWASSNMVGGLVVCGR